MGAPPPEEPIEVLFGSMDRAVIYRFSPFRWRAPLFLCALLGCDKSPTTGELAPVTAVDAPAAHAPLRVATFNTWVVPFRPDHEGIVERIATAIAELDVHVVGLQEVWLERDARALAAALRARGFPWVRWHASSELWAHGSPGLMLASRLPIVSSRFVPYRAGTLPIMMWHPDWYSGKGHLTAELKTGFGPLNVVVTHAQAGYSTNHYDGVRLCQMLELAADVGAHTTPVITLADLNVRRTEPAYASLVERAGVASLQRDFGVDAVLMRDSETIALRELEARPVLERDAEGRLSDHLGVLATIEATPQPFVGSPSRPRAQTSLQERVRDQQRWLTLTGFLAVAFAALAAWSAQRLREREHGSPWGRRARLALASALGVLAFWGVYYAVIYVPAHKHWLAEAESAAVPLGAP